MQAGRVPTSGGLSQGRSKRGALLRSTAVGTVAFDPAARMWGTSQFCDPVRPERFSAFAIWLIVSVPYCPPGTRKPKLRRPRRYPPTLGPFSFMRRYQNALHPNGRRTDAGQF
jgi:hypothetical protein